MNSRLNFFVRAIVLSGILLIILCGLNKLLMPGYFINDYWQSTSTFLGFYEMEKESVDVIFLGSSHAASSFVPQKLYDNYGITSYNLASEQQSMPISYFWLKEALRTQKPKAVVLDMYLLFTYDSKEPLNSPEGCVRKAIDYMKWGKPKIEAIRDICEIDEKHSVNSYIFPNIRYHSRWMELGENDFRAREMRNHYELKGYNILLDTCDLEYDLPLAITDSEKEADVNELAMTYFDKIAKLCDDEGIRLLLVKTPSLAEKQGRHNTEQKVADAYGCEFINFNLDPYYSDIAFDFQHDMRDMGHANIAGAEKLTDYVGSVLQGKYGLKAHEHVDWAKTAKFYDSMRMDYLIREIEDVESYLADVQNDRYCIFVFLNGDLSEIWNDEVQNELAVLGLQEDLMQKSQTEYFAVIETQKVLERVTDFNECNVKGKFRKGRSVYQIKSVGSENDREISFDIDGKDIPVQGEGMHIVVYDNLLRTVVDSVCFTSDPEVGTIR